MFWLKIPVLVTSFSPEFFLKTTAGVKHTNVNAAGNKSGNKHIM